MSDQVTDELLRTPSDDRGTSARAARGYAVHAPADRFAPFSFERRAPNPNDVAIAIRYCGVCHSDLHTARGEWGGTRYPCVPGHEIVGEVTAVGESEAPESGLTPQLAAMTMVANQLMNLDEVLNK